MNEFKVGLFTVGAIICLAFISVKITANKSGFGNYVAYRAIVADATGVQARSSIKVAGINAGKITSIRLEGTRALIEFEVLEEIKISSESVLRIKTLGFLGEKYIDIHLGDPTIERLPEGSFVQVTQGGGIEDLAKDASEVMVDVKSIVKKVNESMENEISPNVMKDILANVHAATESIRRLAQNNEEKINNIVDNVNKLALQLADQTDVNNKESVMADLKKIGPIMDDVKAASADLKVIMGDVRDGKGTVGKLLRDEEVVDKVNETLSGVNRIVNRINNLQAQIGLYTGANTENGARTDLVVDLYPAPERFFRLGVTSSEYGPSLIDEKETTTIRNGRESVVTTKEKDKDSFKFNLQIGRKFDQWAFRAGLIETTGGFGVDYYVLDKTWIISAEAFDFARDDNFALRLMTELRIWNVFYTRVAAEDMINDERSFTFSAGLKFTDQDLAALIGLMR